MYMPQRLPPHLQYVAVLPSKFSDTVCIARNGLRIIHKPWLDRLDGCERFQETMHFRHIINHEW